MKVVLFLVLADINVRDPLLRQYTKILYVEVHLLTQRPYVSGRPASQKIYVMVFSATKVGGLGGMQWFQRL